MPVFECTRCDETHELTLSEYVRERKTINIEMKNMSGAEYPDNCVVTGCDECNTGVLFPPVTSDGDVVEFESEMDKSFTELGVGVDALRKLQKNTA